MSDRLPSSNAYLLWLRRILLAGLAVWLWIALLDFPSYAAAGDRLDSSWQQALGYFLSHRSQAGVDYVFTYGPLGYFATTAYDADLFWWKYAWELGFKLLFSTGVLVIALRLRTGLGIALLLVLILFLPEELSKIFQPGQGPVERLVQRTDPLYDLLILMIGALPACSRRPLLSYLLAAPAVLAVLALVKFTLMVLGLVALAALVVQTLAAGPRWRAVLPPLLYVLFFLGLWVLLGQSLANLPAYFRGSLEISAGYSEAMGFKADFDLTVVALVCAGLNLLALLSYGPLLVRRIRHAVVAVLVVVIGLLVWKHSFARHGREPIIFFHFALLAPVVVLAVLDAKPSRIRAVLFALAIVVAVGGRWKMIEEKAPGVSKSMDEVLVDSVQRVQINATQVCNPATLRSALEQQVREVEEAQQLPRVKAQVGDATIDMISCFQGMILYNHLNYRPRPVFQSYTAYTPYLLEKNAAHFRAEDAPKFILLRLESIDNRFPALEDGLALVEMLCSYQPEFQENGYLLLRRKAFLPDCAAGKIVLDQLVGLDEEVRLDGLPGDFLTLTVDLKYTVWSRGRYLLTYPPVANLVVTLDGEDQPRSYRLIPEMAKTEFPLSPFLQKNSDVVAFYQKEQARRVRAFQISVPEGGRNSFESQVRVVVRAYAK